MKFTLSWLKDHLKTKATVDEIATRLSAIGLEVESVDNPADKLGAFRVARIVEAGKHPNADKLQVVQVEVGEGRSAARGGVRRAQRARRSRSACSRRSALTFPARRSRSRRSPCAASCRTA